jgi:hypothetical protein
MGGPNAPDDFEEGYLTPIWLAVSDDRAATAAAGIGTTADRRIRPSKWKTQSFKSNSPPGSLK